MCRPWLTLGTALLVTGCGAEGSRAQDRAPDWRTVTSSRQLADERALEVHVSYGAGQMVIGPAEAGELYRVGLRYDSELFDPRTDYRSGRLRVGVEGTGGSVRMRDGAAGQLDLKLAASVPLDLDLEFGAVEAELELGGMHVRSVDIETGASDTKVRFSRPNPIACDRLALSMGAAALEATGLGNANCAAVEIEGGLGDLTLDFSGEWRRDMALSVAVALGSVTLVIPQDVGVRVEKNGFLTGFDAPAFGKRDGAHYSSNWSTAPRRLTVEVTGALGSINIRWRNP